MNVDKMYGKHPFNSYMYCPQMPGQKVIDDDPINCNINYDYDKVYDNYVFPSMPHHHRRIEKFGGNCMMNVLKLVIFIIIISILIYLVMGKMEK